jgi:methylenetetrahydrofolate dehydrogenase (NADP+)/methenyltetrahydrofolate cyclohydrolase/formyltetrahydrofolate synthetase
MAKVLSGKDASAQIRKKLQLEVASFGNNFVPGLTIVQVGGRSDSNVYINMKIKAAAEIGIDAKHLKLDRYVQIENMMYASVKNDIFRPNLYLYIKFT